MGWMQGGAGVVPLPGSVQGMERCGSCGWENPAGFRFCGNCRTRAFRPSSAPLPPPPPPAPAASAPPAPAATPTTSEPRSLDRSWGSSVVLPAVGPPPQGPRGLAYLLGMDADGRFDLFGLNSLNLADVLHQAQLADHEALRRLSKEAELLLPRVRQETGSRENVAQLLRLSAERWYLESGATTASATRPSWRTWATGAWRGLFFESRVPGGARTPRLADRLLWISEGKGGPHPARWHLLFGGGSDEETSPTLSGRPPDEVLVLRVAQSILDDLADTPRGDAPTVVLPRLTDLAESASARDVNAALQALLPTYDPDSFLLLDPIRTPGVPLGTLRWPSERGNTAGSAYQIELSAPASDDASVPPTDASGASVGSLRFYLPKWYGPGRTREEWIDILGAMADKQARLPPPPSADCRENDGYRSLRAALVEGPPATDLFEQVSWRGRPRDLPLLNRLLKDGAYTPDEDTDGGYLEAELNDLVSGDPRRGGETGVWKLGSGKLVRRLPGPAGMIRYVVEPVPASSSGSAPGPAGGPAPAGAAAPSPGGSSGKEPGAAPDPP